VTGGVVGCTIVARNYLPYARVVEEGWRRHHAGVPFRVLVIDDDAGRGYDGELLRIVRPADLGLSGPELARMRGMYGVAELTTALKPHLLRHLLDDGAGAVIYLDSDTDVLAGLDGVAALAAEHGVVLSPHLLEPPPRDGQSPNEPEIGWSGLYNSGFVAVGREAGAFLSWWAERLSRDCLFCEPAGLHADQRWLDFAPSYFDHCILRDPGVNVAQWNIHERRIGELGRAPTVNGGPLRTLHFSGFDPEESWVLGRHEWPQPLRFDLEREPVLVGLCRSYSARLLAAGYREERRIPYGYARSAAGTPLETWRRRAYRELVIAADAHGVDIPDPFDVSRSADFERMIADPWATGLLSDAAASRLTDARLAGAPAARGLAGALRNAVTLSRQLARRRPGRRHPWSPHPLLSDRTRLEYRGRSASPAPAVAAAA